MPRLLAAIGAVVLLALAISCSRDTLPTPPTDRGSRLSRITGAGPALPQPMQGVPVLPGALPIDLGDQWEYYRSYVVYSVSATGDRTPLEQFYSRITDAMVCTGTVNGNEYVYRSSAENEQAPGPTTYTWVGERQDARGLYELDANITQPPACGPRPPESMGGVAVADHAARIAESAIARLPSAPPDVRDRMIRQIRALTARAARLEQAMEPGVGVRSGELQRLAYPLTVGREWYVRNQPPDLVLTSQVLAWETYQSWPAAKVGLVWVGTFGPRDSAASWYGKPGLLRFRYHFESEPDSVTGTSTVIENDQRLSYFRLVGNPGIAERQP
jgi:hypothetical protein